MRHVTTLQPRFRCEPDQPDAYNSPPFVNTIELLLPPTKEVYVFARVCLFVCLSVCLLARLLKNACMDLDEMLRVDRCRDMDELINFCARYPDHSPDSGCRNRIAFSDIV